MAGDTLSKRVSGLLVIVVLLLGAILFFTLFENRSNEYLQEAIVGGDEEASLIRIVIDQPVSGRAGYVFSKDSAGVYWESEMDAGSIPADPNTFTSNADIYPFGKDAERVYLFSKVVDGADPGTFRVYPHSFYARDSKSIYWYGGPSGASVSLVPEANVETFSPLVFLGQDGDYSPSYYARDDRHVYCNWEVLEGVDPLTFEQTGVFSGKDGVLQYEGCDVYDPETP